MYEKRPKLICQTHNLDKTPLKDDIPKISI